MSRPIITLTTDFGAGSHYVAQMKGVILSINPNINIVDLSHTIPAQDIRQGAMVLADVTSLFPPESIHLAVVDPGVGTDRKIAYARMNNQHFIAPDNGLLSLVAKKSPATVKLAVTNRKYWRETVSSTFHGRDIMAPVAAHLSLGVDPSELGDRVEKLIRLNVPDVRIDTRQIQGMVVSFDAFGNLITDITSGMLKEARRSDKLEIQCGTNVIREIIPTYGSGDQQSVVALIGSSGMLELAVVNGNAAQRLGVEVGSEISVIW